MRNPFRSERQAFRFLFVVAATAAVVMVVDELAGTVIVGVVAALALLAVVAAYAVGRPRLRELPSAPAHVGPAGERRALLLVDDPLRDESLSSLRERVDRVLVVAPAWVASWQHWASDVDAGKERARERMEEAVARLRAAQLEVSGVVGDEDPFVALDDALRTFGGDEIVACTSDADLIGRLRDRYAIPVTATAAA